MLVGIPPGTLTGTATAAVASIKAGWPAIVHGWMSAALTNYTYGLCGGMAYSALDYWRANWVIPRGFVDYSVTSAPVARTSGLRAAWTMPEVVQ